ncbi:substrate-binding domain-containing protein [Anaerotignum sp.]|uniref:substrate-binding domain-containing protein n=1 Tax=Anaerotignum sp. TaxID=2039241 RepID=UPI0027148238|nr:substrate-binding domain-containing protein [Anaerotignum sp.]
MKRKIGLGLIMLMLTGALAGCGGSGDSAAENNGDAGEAAANNAAITVVSREDGSGTRGAFIELFGIEEKDANGNKVDYTADTAEITNSTAVMMQTVAGNKDAIGYTSLGSMNDSVKALEIDGAAATVEDIKSGTYKIARPFNIATTGDISPAAQDFISFIMSEEGQAVVEENGYISQGNTGAYAASGAEGKVTVAGSSSVTPVMEKLKEAYVAVNSNANVEVQQSDSTTGMTSAIEGICDIGMASRELKDSEIEKGLTPTVIAMDGIAVIVNKDNSVNGLTAAQVKDVFTGAATDWSIAE